MTSASSTPEVPDVSTLFREEHRRVVAFLARRVADRSTAQDLASETFRIAFERTAAGGRVDCAWLFVTARNLLSNHHRRVSTQARYLAADGFTPRVPTTDDELAERVESALEALSPDHQAVLRLRYWDEMSAREAAAVLGCSEAAVWVRLHRARGAFAARWRRGAPAEPGVRSTKGDVR